MLGVARTQGNLPLWSPVECAAFVFISGDDSEGQINIYSEEWIRIKPWGVPTLGLKIYQPLRLLGRFPLGHAFEGLSQNPV